MTTPDSGLPEDTADPAQQPDAAAPDQQASEPTADDGEWLRVHPASPFVRGWLALVAIVFFVGRDSFERLLQGGPALEDELVRRGPWLLGIGGGLLLLAVGGFVLSWYFTRYQVSGGYVRVNTGFLFRQQRQARLDRVQAIDVVQPLLARVFGLAELKFEVADAGESAVRLAYLKMDQARRLRATILARAAGVPHDPEQHTVEVPEAPEVPVLTVPPSRLIGSLLLGEQTIGIGVGALASVVAATLTNSSAFYLYLVPAGLGIAVSYWSAFNKGYNFTAAISPDGIRLRYGLLDTQAQTLPPGRIQALKVVQPLLWRPLGWYRIHVNVAGYGANPGGSSTRTTLLPVGGFDDVLRILALVLPDPGTDRPVEVFSAGLHGMDSDGGFVTSPRRVRMLAPLGWRRNGFTSTDTALLLRSGRWWRELVVIPHQRTQSMALQQGPLARRFDVVDLVLHTTAGPVSPKLIQADRQVAARLFSEQSARARAARGKQTSEQWLAAVQSSPQALHALQAPEPQATVPPPSPQATESHAESAASDPTQNDRQEHSSNG
ncbi:PH domain-containing protein [Pseudarthrobacter sp. J64]|uniref:PH domain-containing protein n=1 Tax=Pseudarthrobacter sp. J64 TaxID=3116485 RepID=UPI003FA7404D